MIYMYRVYNRKLRVGRLILMEEIDWFFYEKHSKFLKFWQTILQFMFWKKSFQTQVA